MALKQTRINTCVACNENIIIGSTSHGICPTCRDIAVRKFVAEGGIDYVNTWPRIIAAMASRVVVLLDGCANVTDAYYKMQGVRDHNDHYYEQPTIYASFKVGSVWVKTTLRDEAILDILTGDLAS